jgi:3-hydroxyisobutyrate dehydrogenase-like beta-hydroxyacid dehydrogenase
MKILVLGAGMMGEPMARRFLKAGHRVLVLPHRREEPIRRLAAEGAARIADLPSAGKEADVVFSMLPNLPQIDEILFGRGLADAMRPGSLFLNMSTVSPQGIVKTAESLGERGIDVLDAPVSGGPVRAADGTLTVMAGGERGVYERYLPLLETVGARIFHTGPVGSGQIAKLCNNLLAAMIMAANAEVMTMGVKAGLGSRLLRDIIQASTGGNRLLEDWIPNTFMRDRYEPGFSLRLMLKDIRLAMQLADETGTPMFLGGAAHQLYRMIAGRSESDAERDFSVVSVCYQEAARVRIAAES